LLFPRLRGRPTFIKADHHDLAFFAGLFHAVHHPLHRTFVGDEPDGSLWQAIPGGFVQIHVTCTPPSGLPDAASFSPTCSGSKVADARPLAEFLRFTF
jgi:hypothetical protein